MIQTHRHADKQKVTQKCFETMQTALNTLCANLQMHHIDTFRTSLEFISLQKNLFEYFLCTYSQNIKNATNDTLPIHMYNIHPTIQEKKCTQR